jgi:formate hydrogenlyase subunit 3/multisubunit Na+/H+ antiporter MnhD subunit
MRAAGEKAVGATLLCGALAAFGLLALGARKLLLLERAVDAGDVVVLAVFALFGSFCAYLGWRLFRTPPTPSMQAPPEVSGAAENAPPTRVKLSHGCAAVGVLLLILSVLVPANWYPVVFLFAGLALLALSHGLTPCVERIEQLRKARDLERQL